MNLCNTQAYTIRMKLRYMNGDILEIDEEGKKVFGTTHVPCRKYQVVGFHEGAFMTGRNNYFPHDYDTYLWVIRNHATVVSTIYDNPELLEVSQ